jgi:putative lipoic acid-binding regulatory protein
MSPPSNGQSDGHGGDKAASQTHRKTNGGSAPGHSDAAADAVADAVADAAAGTAGRPSLLEFPCRFPIKAMGRQSDEFEAIVTAIVLKHAELWPDEPIRSTPSKAGRFVSITAVVEARSQAQLDAIYQDLTDCVHVLVAL